MSCSRKDLKGQISLGVSPGPIPASHHLAATATPPWFFVHFLIQFPFLIATFIIQRGFTVMFPYVHYNVF
jgi:hypothetical protein